MDKRFLTMLACLTLQFSAIYAQKVESLPPQIHRDCGLDDMMDRVYKLHPEILEKQKNSERNYQAAFLKPKEPAWRGAAAVVTIPVVVHVMYLPGTSVGTGENISTAQIEAGIQHLTQAFRKQTAAYAGVGRNANIAGVDVELEFCLAKRDPSGNATNGINRVATALSNLNIASGSTDEINLKNLSRWDTERYLNVWLVKDICSGTSCGTAGFAYLSGAHGQPYDGVVNEASFFGSTADNSKVHIHEVGHYFNLYHTFGSGALSCTNSNCLTDGDRVCDTPPDASSSAVSCGAAQNSCTTDGDDTDSRNPYRSTTLGGLGDQGDNYENYMDYGFQSCQTTYTANQKTRMRAALDGDRVLLKTSLGCQPVSTAALAYFSDTGGSINESVATTAIDCRKYTDFNIPILLAATSTSAVTVNLAIGASTTASNTADFLLTTPSVLIAAGATSGNATLRIFNDKAVETSENIVLNISSATAGVATYNNSYTFTILDNDNMPSGGRPILYTTDFSSATGWNSSAFTAFAANKFTIGANGGSCTTGNSLYVTNNLTSKPNTYSNVDDWPLFYRSINAVGYTGLQARFDYKIGGNSINAYGLVSANPTSGGNIFTNYTLTPDNNVSCASSYVFSLQNTFDNANFDFGFAFRTISGVAAANPSLTIDNLEISANATPISSSIVSTSEYLGPNSTVNFSTASGALLATIENLSNHNYGCTTVEIDRAGTATVVNAGKTFTAKTFKVTPTTNNAAGQHRITLYYAGNEVSGWAGATGASTSAMSIFKSSGSIASATAITEGVSPTANGFGTATAFSATFNTGFSGFAVANSTVLAVDLLSFDGKKDNKSVKLFWKTASEKNNDFFLIEKSIDGQIFEPMTKIISQGISNDILSYETLDANPSVGMNYYRLKSVDKSGIIATSKVVGIAFIEKLKMTVFPNPTRDAKINVALTSDREGNVDFEIIDMVGKTVKVTRQGVVNGLNTITFEGLDISRGVYFIRAKQNNVSADVVRFVKM